MLLASLVLAAASALQAAAPQCVRTDQTQVLRPDSAFEFTHTVTLAGTLSVWVECDDADLTLTAQRDGVETTDDDTGGARNPWIRSYGVQPGETLTFVVRAKPFDGAANARIFTRELPEGEDSRRVAQEALDALARARAEDASGDRQAAVATLGSALATLLTRTEFSSSESWFVTVRTLSRQCEVWFDDASFSAAALARREAMRGLFPQTSEAWTEVQMSVCQAALRAADPRQALPDCEHALALAERCYPPGHLNVAVTLFAVGQIYSAAREFERADELHSRAAAIADAPGGFDPLRLAILLSERGTLALELGRPLAAIEFQRRALETLNGVATEDDDLTLGVLNNLAAALSDLGETRRALAIHERRCAIYAKRVAPDNPEQIGARLNRAVLWLKTGEAQRAADELEELQTLQQRSGLASDTDRELVDIALANAWILTGRADRALALVREREAHRAATGRRDANHAWRLASTAADALRALARAPDALEESEKALTLALRAFPPEHADLAESRLRLAALRVAAGRREGARELAEQAAQQTQAYFARAASTLSVREAEEVQHQWSRLISDGVSLLDATALEGRAADNDRAVFELCESGRSVGAVLLRAWRRHTSSTDARARLDPLRIAAARTAREVARLAGESVDTSVLEAALEARRGAEEQLRAALARELGPLAAPSEIDARSLAARLPSDTAAVAFWRVDRRALDAAPHAPRRAELLAFVLRSDGRVARFELGALAPVERAVDAWLSTLRDNASSAQERDAGAKLRALVLEPLLPALDGARALRLVLDEALHLAPLDALPLDENVRLGERFALVVAPAVELGAERTPAARRRLVAVGGLDYEHGPDGAPALAAAVATRARTSRESFDPLWETQDEIDGIAALFARADERSSGSANSPVQSEACVLLTERDATKSALIAAVAPATHVHIATHGFFARESDRDPEERAALAQRAPLSLCGLALSGANDAELGAHEGLVTADELAQLDLSQCELVVLSACDTNVGARASGQGVASFQKALHAAGAQFVLTSLWKVDDSATRELMLEFYAGLWSERLAPPQALARAKSKLRERRAPPRDWAGWTLSSL
jgi:CHAT domain-containing protein